MSIDTAKQVLRLFLLLFVLGLFACVTPCAQAFFTHQPIDDYQEGIKFLRSYRGNPHLLKKAHDHFSALIFKHPDSPFGYLGMSQLKTLEAYRDGNNYNIKKIVDEAMPMALKAMHFGPAIKEVHTNYDQLERIFSDNDKNQEQVRKLLVSFPSDWQTYFSLANYITNQGDFEKAAEYYKIALGLADDDTLKLKTIQRIAWIYLYQLSDAQLAAVYYESALALNPDMPSVWESLGKAYLRLGRYDLSVENFKKAFGVFSTEELQNCLSKAEGLVKQQSNFENNQNTSLHCSGENLYYSDEGKNPEFLSREISQR